MTHKTKLGDIYYIPMTISESVGRSFIIAEVNGWASFANSSGLRDAKSMSYTGVRYMGNIFELFDLLLQDDGYWHREAENVVHVPEWNGLDNTN